MALKSPKQALSEYLNFDLPERPALHYGKQGHRLNLPSNLQLKRNGESVKDKTVNPYQLAA